MVSQKSNLTKILIAIIAFIAFVVCSFPSRAESDFDYYFTFTIDQSDSSFYDFVYSAQFTFDKPLAVHWDGYYYHFYVLENNFVTKYKFNAREYRYLQGALISEYDFYVNGQLNIISGAECFFESNIPIFLNKENVDAYLFNGDDSGQINKPENIYDLSLLRYDYNFGLSNVIVDCVDNILSLSWSLPISLPDDFSSMPVMLDLLIEDLETGESSIYYYPATESISARPSICDVSDLTFSFDVGNIKDIPEYFKIKSVSLTPYYVQHLEYLDMDIMYKGQTSHVFLNYVGHDEKPIYSAPVVQLPADTDIIDQDMPTSIFGAITNFFSGFFNNFGTMLKNLFIPTKAQLTSLFGSLEAFFNDKLGFLWYPFDLAIQIVEALSQGEAKSTITFPGFTLPLDGGIQIWSDMEFEIDQVGIFPVVRMVTSIVLACSVAGLAYKKWDEWIGGVKST